MDNPTPQQHPKFAEFLALFHESEEAVIERIIAEEKVVRIRRARLAFWLHLLFAAIVTSAIPIALHQPDAHVLRLAILGLALVWQLSVASMFYRIGWSKKS